MNALRRIAGSPVFSAAILPAMIFWIATFVSMALYA